MSVGTRVIITANAEVVTAAEIAVATALNNTDLRGRWEVPEVKALLNHLFDLGFKVVRSA